MSHDPFAVAMHGNLDVMPCLGSPGRGIAANVGVDPLILAVLTDCVLPFLEPLAHSVAKITVSPCVKAPSKGNKGRAKKKMGEEEGAHG